MSIIYFAFVLYILVLANGIKFQPMLIEDQTITLKRVSAGQYEINLKVISSQTKFQSMIYCFKQMTTVLTSFGKTCKLQQAVSWYTCIEQNYSDFSSTGLNIYWNQFKLYQTGEMQDLGDQNIDIEGAVNTNIVRSIILKNQYLKNQTVYQMLIATSRQNLLQNPKICFSHTYSHSSYFDTLLVQRNNHCIVHNNKRILIFQGAVSRDGVPHFFTGILVYTVDNVNFQMWGGYSYSASHAGRDMMGYETQSGNFYDLFSLFAAAPYEDIQQNISGEKNIVRISNSQNSSLMTPPYHFIQFYRLFQTLDQNGDQIIREKIYNTFCFAAYFKNTTSSSTSISITSNGFKHDLINCHYPVLTIYGQHMHVYKILLLILGLASFCLK